ncbi:MAG: hypothetical protein J6Y69_02025 [Treponema sp.]|nr:hypothetical protein [Treponema sp.]
MKKLILASVLVVVAALFTACGGAGSPGSGDDEGERMGTLKSTTNSPWANFEFELFPDSEADQNIAYVSEDYQTYTIPQGSWKATRITHEFDRVYKEYYEFTSPETGYSVSTSKYVIVISDPLTDEEIAELEDMDPHRFDFEYVDSSATFSDYYLDDHTFVTISEYNGSQIWRNDFYKEMYGQGITKTNSDSTLILDKKTDDSVKIYMEKNH